MPDDLRREIAAHLDGGLAGLHGRPARGTPSARVLYLHGGAYIREITRHHWKLLGQLTSAGAEVTVPIYPVAPSGTASHVVAASADLARKLAADGLPVIVAGDSAGGGLALAVALALRDHGIRGCTRAASRWRRTPTAASWIGSIRG